MNEDQIMKNIIAVMNFVKEKLPKGNTNIKDAYIKLTMGSPVKLKV